MQPFTLFGLHAGESRTCWADLISRFPMSQNKQQKTSLQKSETTVAIPATLPARCTHPLWRRGGCLLKQRDLHSTTWSTCCCCDQWALSIQLWRLTFRPTPKESMQTDARKCHENVAIFCEQLTKGIYCVLKLFVNDRIIDIDQLKMLTGSSEGSGRNSASSPKIKSGGNSGYRALNMMSPAIETQGPMVKNYVNFQTAC